MAVQLTLTNPSGAVATYQRVQVATVDAVNSVVDLAIGHYADEAHWASGWANALWVDTVQVPFAQLQSIASFLAEIDQYLASSSGPYSTGTVVG